MDKKNTIIAVVLMVILMIGAQFVLNWINPPKTTTVGSPSTTTTDTSQELNKEKEAETGANTALSLVPQPVDEQFPEKEIVASTSLYEVTFSTKGGVVTSYKLKKHLDNGNPLEMVNTTNGGSGAFFELAFGENKEKSLTDVFQFTQKSEKDFEFSKNFKDLSGNTFTVKKIYTLIDGEFLLDRSVIKLNRWPTG